MVDQPLVSVVMANHRGAAFLPAAIESVLAQTLNDLELIIVDDASPDESVRIIEGYARRDDRIRLIALAQNAGPAAARNRGLDNARGTWIAIVDSDDVIHPERLRTLVDAAAQDHADLVADDLLIFDDTSTTVSTMLPDGAGAFWVSPAAFVRANSIYRSGPVLGYCKPVIRASALESVRYDESLRIGEDFDLLFRLMSAGHRLRIYPELLYFYRRHSGSISHRFEEQECRSLIASGLRLMQARSSEDPDLQAAHVERLASLKRALAFAQLVRSLKARSLSGTAAALRTDPRALWLLRLPIAALVSRLIAKARPRRRAETGQRRVVVLSRQRIAGPINGSSAYLLSIARYLRAQGLYTAYLSPSPTTFGRWPFLTVGAATRAGFDSLAIRGGIGIGSYIVARDPRVWARAFLTVAEDALLRARVLRRRRIAPAPYAVSVPLTRRDKLFLARHGRRADALLLDYAFLTPARPYALLGHQARALVIMHDLFSSREAQFAKTGSTDSVALLTRDEEFALLSRSDGVIAIQAEEARAVASSLPGTAVIVAPMAVTVQSRPAPGRDGTLLFVGSNTAPNVIGLQWFLDEVWPLVVARHPAATLDVVGSVSRGLAELPAGVSRSGVVPDLSERYEQAGVVISPLTVGSGLKVKLVEAMSFGKAIVATTVTVEGVADRVSDVVAVADERAAFAEAINALLYDAPRRICLGQGARDVAAAAFTAEACYAPIMPHLLPRSEPGAPSMQARHRSNRPSLQPADLGSA